MNGGGTVARARPRHRELSVIRGSHRGVDRGCTGIDLDRGYKVLRGAGDLVEGEGQGGVDVVGGLGRIDIVARVGVAVNVNLDDKARPGRGGLRAEVSVVDSSHGGRREVSDPRVGGGAAGRLQDDGGGGGHWRCGVAANRATHEALVGRNGSHLPGALVEHLDRHARIRVVVGRGLGGVEPDKGGGRVDDLDIARSDVASLALGV